MSRYSTISITIFLSILFMQVQAQDWKPATDPLSTRRTKFVSANNTLPEYPRPQMVREEWLNLNGLWDIKFVDGTGSILVPFPIESALSGIMKHTDRMTYRRLFETPKGWRGKQVLLHFGAVDWEAKVSVKGKQLGVHKGGYDPFSFDITQSRKANGENVITVEVTDPTNKGGQPRGKQTLTPDSIMYTPTSGIWQTVWLEPVKRDHIESLKLVPNVNVSCLRLTVAGTGTVEIVASDNSKKVAQITGLAGSELRLAIPNPKLWSPDSPHLYDLKVTLKSGKKVVDQVTSYFGMRKISLGKDEKGSGDKDKKCGDVIDMHKYPGLSAVIYTQLTDVETEGNGLLTYDREINKVLPERAAAVNLGKLSPEPVFREVISTSQSKGFGWRYTLNLPGSEWNKPTFDVNKIYAITSRQTAYEKDEPLAPRCSQR